MGRYLFKAASDRFAGFKRVALHLIPFYSTKVLREAHLECEDTLKLENPKFYREWKSEREFYMKVWYGLDVVLKPVLLVAAYGIFRPSAIGLAAEGAILFPYFLLAYGMSDLESHFKRENMRRTGGNTSDIAPPLIETNPARLNLDREMEMEEKFGPDEWRKIRRR